MTTLVAWPCLGTAVLLVGSVGCGVLTSQPPPPQVQPDLKTIVAVVEEAYGQLEQAASVFLGADDVEDTTMARVRTTLSDDLASTFRPSMDRISGDPGASIALGRFNLEDNGRLTVVASFVQDDGTGRGCTRYTLDRDGDDWVIAQAADAWPDCPISRQGEETYHAALNRAQGEDCLALGTGIGMCGAWLYVVESSGFHGTRSYFDPQTGLVVAKEAFSDADEVADLFVFGHVECEPNVTETIACGECWVDADCQDDGLFCNGRETCVGGTCESSGNHCAPESFCDEDADSCGEPPVPGQPCSTDEDCPLGVCPGGSRYSKFVCSNNVCAEVLYVRDPCEPECDENGREACEVAGGVWQVWGLSECPGCNLRNSDSGAQCTDSQECEGWCITNLFPDALCEGVVVGQCSEFRTPFGCFCELHEGNGYGVCVD